MIRSKEEDKLDKGASDFWSGRRPDERTGGRWRRRDDKHHLLLSRGPSRSPRQAKQNAKGYEIDYVLPRSPHYHLHSTFPLVAPLTPLNGL